MKCLVCGAEMKTPIIDGVEVDLCPRCGGVWLDGGELEALTGHSLEEYRELPCPECGGTMSIRLIGDVEVDYCTKCGGTWLDQGELEAIKGVPPDGNVDPSRFEQFLRSVASRRNLEIAKEATRVEGDAGPLLLIDNVFLMYRNGVMITSVTHKRSPTIDEDVLGGMLTAIQDFIEVSFQNIGDSTIKGIKFRGREIVFAKSENLITAMLVSGDLPRHFHDNVDQLLAKVEDRYGETLPTWSGNLDELEGIEGLIQGMFTQE